MTRTFIATLIGATVLGFGANAMTLDRDMGGAVDPTIKQAVIDDLYRLSVPDSNVGDIEVVRKYDQNGEIKRYKAWIDLETGGSLVLSMDTAGDVLRSYTVNGDLEDATGSQVHDVLGTQNVGFSATLGGQRSPGVCRFGAQDPLNGVRHPNVIEPT